MQPSWEHFCCDRDSCKVNIKSVGQNWPDACCVLIPCSWGLKSIPSLPVIEAFWRAEVVPGQYHHNRIVCLRDVDKAPIVKDVTVSFVPPKFNPVPAISRYKWPGLVVNSPWQNSVEGLRLYLNVGTSEPQKYTFSPARFRLPVCTTLKTSFSKIIDSAAPTFEKFRFLPLKPRTVL